MLLQRLDEAAPPDRTRITCSWAELAELMQGGVEIGGHSAKPCQSGEGEPETNGVRDFRDEAAPLSSWANATSSLIRMEWRERRSSETTALLQQNGFRFAFLTHSDFANTRTDRMYLPRIALPDRPMSHAEFCLRAAGAGVVYRKLKRMRN